MKEAGDYVIIAGANKSGTTSLFSYLADHQAIGPSKVKQTNYFLEKDYPYISTSPSLNCIDHPEQYGTLFSQEENTKWRLEASPDYLYSKHTVEAIAKHFAKQPRLIFILRHPVTRLTSYFHHLQRSGQLPATLNASAFIEEGLLKGNQEFYRYLIDTSKYVDYLKPFYQNFSTKNILLLFTEQLKEQPEKTMKKVCTFLDIDATMYQDYTFEILNQRSKAKNKKVLQGYRQLRNFGIHLMNQSRLVAKLLQYPANMIRKTYKKVNTEKVKPVKKAAWPYADELHQYYATSVEELEQLTGVKTPWDLALVNHG